MSIYVVHMHEQIACTCQGKLVVCAGLQVKENLFSCTHEQLKLVKKNCSKKNVFIVHTSKESYQGTCQGKLGRLSGALSFGERK